MKKAFIFILSVSVLSSCMNTQKENPVIEVSYPETKKVDQVDDYFGTKVSDSYRWLEDDNAEDTKAWVESQNKTTFDYLGKIPYREKIRSRLTELMDYPKFGSITRVGEYYFFTKNNGLQNQAVIYYQKGLTGTPEVFLDPNTFSKDGTVAVTLSGFSNDKKYATYNVARSGSDWQDLFVMEIATKKVLDDKIEWVKFSGSAWKGDGFYYSRYDKPAPGMELSSKNEYQKVYFHKLGTKQDADKLVYVDKAHPLRYHSASVTEDERFLFLYISEGTGGSQIFYQDLKAGQQGFKPLVADGFENNPGVIDNVGDQILLLTDHDAPNKKVVMIDPANPAKENWKTIIAEKPEPIEGVGTAGGKLFVNYLKDVSTKVYQYGMAGKEERVVELPGIGTAGGFYAEKNDKNILYTYTSFTCPNTIYNFDIESGKSSVFLQSELKFDVNEYETKQVFYTSKDGTKVPMFIVSKKGIELDGTHPTLLYGYGGFNVNLNPAFSISNIILLENGGVYALANLRGGSEYGEKWHKAGMRLNKQNVFDDFIAAGEYLVKEKYSNPEKLAISGGSNGGLLVGACANQRPDLFKVAFPAVGVMDMLRFQKFTVGFGWVDEYGSSDSTKYFKYLYGYSPLHNIKEGVERPATMVTTADHDDRVVPAHSFKYAATLQAAYKGKRPMLIRIDTKAGHGAGKSLTKIIDEQTDKWSFMFYNTNSVVKY